MTWRDVFDGEKRMWGHRDLAARKAANCGYKFLAWAGWVWWILDDEGNVADTGIQTKDI